MKGPKEQIDLQQKQKKLNEINTKIRLLSLSVGELNNRKTTANTDSILEFQKRLQNDIAALTKEKEHLTLELKNMENNHATKGAKNDTKPTPSEPKPHKS